ncbi:MAG: hypothetical protein J6C53_01895 [Clostridia bacterium]|nr:hypothetical protein [Clostridia bacterium]
MATFKEILNIPDKVGVGGSSPLISTKVQPKTGCFFIFYIPTLCCVSQHAKLKTLHQGVTVRKCFAFSQGTTLNGLKARWCVPFKVGVGGSSPLISTKNQNRYKPLFIRLIAIFVFCNFTLKNKKNAPILGQSVPKVCRKCDFLKKSLTFKARGDIIIKAEMRLAFSFAKRPFSPKGGIRYE